jgi:hypothetical protein
LVKQNYLPISFCRQARALPTEFWLCIEISWHIPDTKIGLLYITFCVPEDFPKKIIHLIKLLYKPTVHFKTKPLETLQNGSDDQGHMELELTVPSKLEIKIASFQFLKLLGEAEQIQGFVCCVEFHKRPQVCCNRSYMVGMWFPHSWLSQSMLITERH